MNILNPTTALSINEHAQQMAVAACFQDVPYALDYDEIQAHLMEQPDRIPPQAYEVVSELASTRSRTIVALMGKAFGSAEKSAVFGYDLAMSHAQPKPFKVIQMGLLTLVVDGKLDTAQRWIIVDLRTGEMAGDPMLNDAGMYPSLEMANTALRDIEEAFSKAGSANG
jgi:hypothetical protein